MKRAILSLRYDENNEALHAIIVLIQAEFVRRKAAALSVLPEQMPHELKRHVLMETHLLEDTDENATEDAGYFTCSDDDEDSENEHDWDSDEPSAEESGGEDDAEDDEFVVIV